MSKLDNRDILNLIGECIGCEYESAVTGLEAALKDAYAENDIITEDINAQYAEINALQAERDALKGVIDRLRGVRNKYKISST